MKMLVYLVAAVATMFSTPVMADTPSPGPSAYFIHLDLIKRITCTTLGGLDQQIGTAFYISDKVLITAAHVVAGTTACSIDDNPITIRSIDKTLDYAILETTISSVEYLTFTCSSYERDHVYTAVGYALGKDFVIQPMRGSTSIEDQKGFGGEVRLIGKSFPGMSGGPIFDELGRVVGIVNGGDEAGRASAVSRELRETLICK